MACAVQYRLRISYDFLPIARAGAGAFGPFHHPAHLPSMTAAFFRPSLPTAALPHSVGLAARQDPVANAPVRPAPRHSTAGALHGLSVGRPPPPSPGSGPLRPRLGDLPAIDMAAVDIADALCMVDLPRAGGARGLPSRTAQAFLQRAVLEGMRDFAGQAYTVAFDEVTDRGGMCFAADRSSAATKCWENLEHPQVLAVVLGFAGTRMEDPDDLMCDLKSQIPRHHANPLASGLPGLGPVGSGWQERWHAEARAPRADGLDLAGLLMRYAGMAQDSGRTLSVSVAGHSLGAVVATLASFDIAHFLDANGARGKVSTYAFNPPRLGMETVARRYIAPKSGGGMAFALRQFTRALDPIQSMPMLMHHPGWAASPRPGTYAAPGNPQIVTYQDRWADRVNLSANHELPHWQPVIASAMQAADLEGIFGNAGGEWPPPEGARPTSRT